MIHEYAKVRLKTGEIAHIVEILKPNAAYVAEVVRKNGEFSVSIEQLLHDEIASVFTETETPLAQAG
jgi:hypothetical protein